MEHRRRNPTDSGAVRRSRTVAHSYRRGQPKGPCEFLGEPGAQERLSHPRGIQSLSCRTRNAQVFASPAGQGSLAGSFDDSARLLHHEAERDDRDVAGDMAGILTAPSLCAIRAEQRVPGIIPPIGNLAGGDYGVCLSLVATERWFSG